MIPFSAILPRRDKIIATEKALRVMLGSLHVTSFRSPSSLQITPRSAGSPDVLKIDRLSQVDSVWEHPNVLVLGQT